MVKGQYEDDDDVPFGRNSFQMTNGKSNFRLSQQTRGGMPSGAGVREDVFQVWMEMEECRNVLTDIETLVRTIEAESEQSKSCPKVKFKRFLAKPVSS